MKTSLLVLVATALLATLVVPALGLGGGDGRKVLDANVLAPVTGPYVATTIIRGVTGGGLPWQLESGQADLRAGGRLHVEVEGLVLAQHAPVPTTLQGTNPIPQFEAIVSCQTIAGDGSAAVTNVATAPFAASTDGDAETDTTVDLPSPCYAPVVFVASSAGPSTGAWFAATGR
jgi:hypothetical protein